MTDEIVVIVAYRQAFCGLANTIGASNTSGGIGKNTDSAKVKKAKTPGANLCFAHCNVQSYNRVKIFKVVLLEQVVQILPLLH